MTGLRNRFGGRSLRGRLSWSASAVVAVWVLLLAVGANLLLSRALAGQADGVLRARAEAVALTLEVAPSGGVTVDGGSDDRALDVGTWIFAGDGTVVEGPPGSSPRLDRVARDLVGRGTQTVEIGDEDPLRFLALPVRAGDSPGATVVVSTSLAPYRQLERLALWGSAGAALALLVIVHLVLRATVGRALRPVQQMSRQAARWSADDVDRRFGVEPRPTELAQLAGTLDGVLDRISAVLRHEQRLTDELSHELRTPLARLRAEVELARERPSGDPAVPQALVAVDAAAGDMQQIIETLLRAGRAGGSAGLGRCRPADEADALVSATAAPPPVQVRNDIDQDLVAGIEGPVLRRILAPVVENALRYARSTVTLTGTRTADGVLLVVADDGPGVPAEDRGRVFQPGWRGDPDDDHAGGGLGLALAARLTAACAGSIVCRPDAAGGRFEVLLPPA